MPRLLIGVLALVALVATAACDFGGGASATPTAAAGSTPVAPVAQPTPTLAQGRLVVNVLPAGPQVQLAGAQCTVLGPDGRTVQMAARAGTAQAPAPASTAVIAAQDPARVNVAVEHRGQELTLDCQITMEPRGATPAAGAATPAPGGRQVTTTDAVNLRQSASTTATILTVVPTGTQVTVTGEETAGGVTWYQVTYDNQQGWISSAFTR